MYHPFALDQIRIQQDELRRRTAAARWSHEAIVSRPRRARRQWWPRPARSLVRLAFADSAVRPMPPASVDC
jgi:hypothetical protein